MRPRPVYILGCVLLFIGLTDSLLYINLVARKHELNLHKSKISVTVAALGLSDLCISTEARYTRHPAVSDSVVPFMDYPGATEHFPTGSFWAPVNLQ